MTNILQYDLVAGKVLAPVPQVLQIIPVIAGTEDGHFFAVAIDTPDFVVGVRQLNQDCGTLPVQNGESVRIRVELKGDQESNIVCFIEALGFTQKDAGHYSVVRSDAGTILEAISAFVEATL